MCALTFLSPILPFHPINHLFILSPIHYFGKRSETDSFIPTLDDPRLGASVMKRSFESRLIPKYLSEHGV